MGIFGGRSRRNRSEYDELRRNQEEQAKLNADFRRIVKENEELRKREIEELGNEIMNLRAELRSLRRDKTKTDIEKAQARAAIEKQRSELEKEAKKREEEKKLSEKERKQAKEYIEKAKIQLREAMKSKDTVAVEKIEKKLRENIIIFKAQYKEKPNIKELKFAGEMIYLMGEYYYRNKEYAKALSYYLECENFKIEKSNLNYRIIDSAYKCGRYDDVEKYLEVYSENDSDKKIDEWILKSRVYINIDKKEKVEENLLNVEKMILTKIFENKVSKEEMTLYLESLKKYIYQYSITEDKILNKLFFGYLYLKKLREIEKLLEDFKEYENSEYFYGLIALKENNLDAAKKIIKKYYGYVFGGICISSFDRNNLDKEDIKEIDRILKIPYEEEKLLPYLIGEETYRSKLYDLLEAKLTYVFNNDRKGLSNIKNEIISVLETENVGSGEEKGNKILWKKFKEVLDYLKQIEDPLYEEYLDIFIKNTNEETRGVIDKITDEIKVDIEDEYNILEKRDNSSTYEEFYCENIHNKKRSNYIEFIETMSKKRRGIKEAAIVEEKMYGENNSSFIKIENFNLDENKIKVVTEDYDKLYSEIRDEICVLNTKERFDEVFELIVAFKNLEKEGVYIRNLSEDNLVKKGNIYKFRFLNYMKTLNSNSLSSTNSVYKNKTEKYNTPDNEEGSKSNIYILGELLFDIFYGYHILDGVVPEFSKGNLIKIKTKFHLEDYLDIALLSHLPKEKLYMVNGDKAKIKKLDTVCYVPKEIMEILNKMLSASTFERPTIEEVENYFEEIENQVLEYNNFIPRVVEKENLKKLLEKNSKDIKKIYTKNKKFKFEGVKYFKDLISEIILKMKNGDEFYINDLKNGNYEVCKKEEEVIDYNKKIEFYYQKIENILNLENYNKFAKKNKISIDNSEILLYSIKEILDRLRKNGIYEISKEDKAEFRNARILSELDLEKLSTKEGFTKVLIRLMEED